MKKHRADIDQFDVEISDPFATKIFINRKIRFSTTRITFIFREKEMFETQYQLGLFFSNKTGIYVGNKNEGRKALIKYQMVGLNILKWTCWIEIKYEVKA